MLPDNPAFVLVILSNMERVKGLYKSRAISFIHGFNLVLVISTEVDFPPNVVFTQTTHGPHLGSRLGLQASNLTHDTHQTQPFECAVCFAMHRIYTYFLVI